MPAKKQITKQTILNSAYELVRRGGVDALNMRAVADMCKCSTQPIYLSFRGADELRAAVLQKTCETFDAFIEREISAGKYPEYKAVGMGYIRFAVEEPELFKFLFMRKRENEEEFEKNSFDKSTFLIMKNYGLYKDDAFKLHAEMWIFVHGIATMFATGYLDWDWDTVSDMVTDAYQGLMWRLKQGEHNDNKH